MIDDLNKFTNFFSLCVCLSVSQSVSLSACVSVSLSVCLSVPLSVCLSVCPSLPGVDINGRWPWE
jgi:hypothetical protein